VLIEDMDLAPFEILSALVPLLESGELYIASRNVSVKAREGFRLFGTRTTGQAGRRESAGLPMLQALTTQVAVDVWSDDEVAEVVAALHPKLGEYKLVPLIAQLHALIGPADSLQTVAGVRYRRVLTMRDILKLCRRLGAMLPAAGGSGYLTEALREGLLREALDCFCNMLPHAEDRLAVSRRLAAMVDISQDRVEHMLTRHKPDLKPQAGTLQVGRIYLDELDGSRVAAKLSGKGGANEQAVFCGTVHAMQTLEAVAAAIHYREPVLLTGETGTGKTSLVQHLASLVGAEMVVVNLNQQSDTGDLLGGFKPVEVRQLAQELMDDLMQLLPKVVSKSKNTAFLESCRDKFEAQKWKPLIKLLAQAAALVESLIAGGKGGGGAAAQKHADGTVNGGKRKSSDGGQAGEGAGNSEKTTKSISPQVRRLWRAFSHKVGEFARKVEAIQGRFAFAFVEGVLVKALREGHWLLLDEVNLAPAETLQRLSGLLDGDSGSIALTERGDIDVVQRHPNFRLFACMNPATDVGKKDLPVSLRARFTEIFVDEMEDESELREVVQSYLRGVSKNQHVVDIVSFYLAARALARKGDLFDGANQKVHFNLRSLTRTLQYVNFMQMQGYTFERALFEGACMVFATQLHPVCQPLMDKAILQHLCRTASTAGNSKPNLSDPDHYVCMGQYTHGKTEFTGFYLKKGQGYGKLAIPTFILTPACQLNLRNIVRAAAPHRYPILLQGPTSAGKTSMIEYLAASTGHGWVRINNHAHTDVQEYLGAYASDRFGKLVFCEGPLVKALRSGHWLVLDELNLAPSEVLEMLNRLLDDNRELLIPETQEIVKPHPHFMLFATQNPAGGAYGGRKVMSRAFRNRFLEVHVDDIPVRPVEWNARVRCSGGGGGGGGGDPANKGFICGVLRCAESKCLARVPACAARGAGCSLSL
jgi:midasin